MILPKVPAISLQKQWCMVFILLPFLAISQQPFTQDTDDVTAAPIDDYIYMVLALVGYVTYSFFKTRRGVKRIALNDSSLNLYYSIKK